MSKRTSMKEKRRSAQQRQRYILIGIVAVAVLVVVALIAYPYLKPPFQGRERPQVMDNSSGDPNAPVKIEEFSDFQCPYCRLWTTENEEEFFQAYVETGKVHFTYVPYSFLGPESVRASEAAYCAMDQGKFWEYHDILFANQGGENTGTYSDSNLKTMARDLRLELTQFNDCFDSGKYTQKVKDNLTYGQDKGVNGTPYFLVNGTTLVDSSQLVNAVETALQAVP